MKENNKKITMSDVLSFVGQRQTLMLSTSNKDAELHSSYAPFVSQQLDCYYIYISQLAEHTQNLLFHMEKNKNVSVLMIEDEQQSRNIFARKRLTLSCKVETIERGEIHWEEMMKLFKQRFDKTIDVLMQLEDFILFKLTPVSGQYVEGFGKAYTIEANKIKHIGPAN